MLLDLDAKYAEYNQLYFDNHLPSNIKVEWAVIADDRDAEVDLSADPPTISMSLELYYQKREKLVLFSLIHEMAHVAVDLPLVQAAKLKEDTTDAEDHGAEFQAEMKRLANLGCFESLW